VERPPCGEGAFFSCPDVCGRWLTAGTLWVIVFENLSQLAMTPIGTAVAQAAGALQEIADSTTGARRSRAAAVAMVLRVVELELLGGADVHFPRRRAEWEILEAPAGAERVHLQRILALGAELRDGGSAWGLGEALVEYGCELEVTRRLPEADAVLTLALSVVPEAAEVALHAGRIARKQGDHARALELYLTARFLDGSGGSVGRLADVGAAVVSADAERALGRALRAALRAGDHEVAGVALEERARVRRARGARRAAGRDLCTAALRYPDSVDRARVAHQLADLFVSADDPLAAREALFLALAVGDGSQREHARGRLHTVSRDLGDRVGMRRWRSFGGPALVSLSARPGLPVVRSSAPLVARWREHVESGGRAELPT
jgi:tetratricopeptide (TPR) repeat protein